MAENAWEMLEKCAARKEKHTTKKQQKMEWNKPNEWRKKTIMYILYVFCCKFEICKMLFCKISGGI